MENTAPIEDKNLVKYSYSKLDTYVQCGFKYKLVYVDHKSVWSDNIATVIGKLVHSTEEEIAKLIQAKQPIDYVRLKNNFIAQLAKIEAKFPVEYRAPDKTGVTYWEKAYFYLDRGIYRLEKFMNEHPTYEITGIEQPFSLKYERPDINPCIFKGFIDRVFHDTATDTYIVQDIKTYAEPVAKDKLATPLQFVVYTLAAKEIYNVDYNKVSCQYDLPFLDITQDAGTSGYMKRGEDKIARLFMGIDTEDFKPNPTPLCHWCEFSRGNPNSKESSQLCPYYSHWTREHPTFKVENEWAGVENHPAVLDKFFKEHNIMPNEGGEQDGKGSTN